LGILKDLDILREEPETREWIKRNASTSFDYIKTKFLRRDPEDSLTVKREKID
jgi:hypothetical protein